jgi:DNA-binding beta-propeller fold protein YncE
MSVPSVSAVRIAFILLVTSFGNMSAASFGTVIPVRGHVSDIALDTARGVLYAANFTANRIEVLSLSSRSLQSPINVALQPSAVAVSPNGRFLVVGHYGVGNTSPVTALTVIDLDSGGKQRTISLGTASVLAAAFGNSPSALIVTTVGVSLLDPLTGALTNLILTDFASAPVPVSWAELSRADHQRVCQRIGRRQCDLRAD